MLNPWKLLLGLTVFFILVRTLAARILLKALSKPEK